MNDTSTPATCRADSPRVSAPGCIRQLSCSCVKPETASSKRLRVSSQVAAKSFMRELYPPWLRYVSTGQHLQPGHGNKFEDLAQERQLGIVLCQHLGPHQHRDRLVPAGRVADVLLGGVAPGPGGEAAPQPFADAARLDRDQLEPVRA